MTMEAGTFVAQPRTKLQARTSFIDRSAWISGLSYLAGLALVGPSRIAAEIASGGPGLYLLPATYILFIAIVLMVQRHMHLSLLASSFGAPRQLVTTGVFRYSRNPIYVAFFLPLAALAILSLAAAIASIGIYILAMYRTVIRKEERELLQAFGPEFANYLTKAPRWLF